MEAKIESLEKKVERLEKLFEQFGSKRSDDGVGTKRKRVIDQEIYEIHESC